MKPTIYHNPRCSKSRATLALLQARGIEPTVVRYLETPPDAALLQSITGKLGCSIRDIIRTGEEVYRELGIEDKTLSEAEVIDIVAANPKLLQRPIVINGDRAAIGRPPGNVLAILQP